ncbi:hypothetical protein Mapa_004640 [Marchantia paleacea]|nr:hypothetical protein Mapa_004640 [Marchantia paleacea]
MGIKPFSCPVSGCSCTYKRQDHLNRHMKIHEGARFSCTIPGCDRSFSMMTNLTRHLKYHAEKPIFPKPKWSGEKKHKCSNPGCEKTFRYQSELRSHEDTVHSIVFAEYVCIYPGCGEKLTSEAALLKHAVEAHPYLLCEVCGETISRQAYRRHVRTHGTKKPVKVTCPYEGCTHHYTRESNLRSHIRSFHLKLKPYVCSIEGCDKSFAHKAARNRHELSAVHFHTGTDFEAAELAEPSKSKGGRKKVCFDKVEDLYIRRGANKILSGRAKRRHHHIESQGEEEVEVGTLESST